MSSQLSRTNSNIHRVPKIKLPNNNKTAEMRESILSLDSKSTAANVQTIQQKSTPLSLRPVSRKINKQMSMFLTPNERQSIIKESPQVKSSVNDGQKSGAFSDYYNQQCQQQNKLPSINKNSSNKTSSNHNLDDNESGCSSAPKMTRQKTHTFSSEVSNFDLTSSASTQDNFERTKGKSSFFRLKPQPSPAAQASNNQNINSNFASVQSERLTIEEDKQVGSNNISPLGSSDPSGFLNKQSLQQLNIKYLYEEQKRQLQSVEEFTSPFPPKSQRKKPSGRMSLNASSVLDITQQAHQQTILSERVGGQPVLKGFVQELILAMKRTELFDIILEDYHQNFDVVHERLYSFILIVLSDNNQAIQTSIQDFLGAFYSLTDATIFQLKAFLFEFLTQKACINNTFIDKELGFKLIEILEVNRSTLTKNEEIINLYEVSQLELRNSVIEHCVTSEFFKKFELEKINQFSKGLIDLLFNKISSLDFVNLFQSAFSANLTQVHLNLLKDVLKKSLADLREYNSVFRKNISYQLKKVQWLLPAQNSAPNYIEIVRSCPDLDKLMVKIAPQILAAPQQDPTTFLQFLKLFYSKHNIFNMVDIFQIFNPKEVEQSKQRIIQLSSLLRNTLLASKITTELSKKIETFTLSIFD